MRLYLITHAHTEQVQDVNARQWVLSEQGKAQAEALARQPFWEDVDIILLSSEQKTRLTVQPVLTERLLPVWVEARFDELRRPGWVDDYPERVRRALAEPAQPAGDWEPALHALDRFMDAMTLMKKRFVGQETLALVGHGLILSLYRAHLLGQSQVDFEAWRTLSFASVALVDPMRERILEDFQPVAGAMPRA